MLNFKDAYFENLLIATKEYGTVYITDDGNMYRQEWQAKTRMNDALKVHRQVRWCKVERGHEPLNNEELDRMFNAQFIAAMTPMNAESEEDTRQPIPSLSRDEARQELEKLRKERETAKPGRKPSKAEHAS